MKRLNFLSNLACTLLLMYSMNKVQAQVCTIDTRVNGIAGTATATSDIGQSFTACSSGTLSTVKVGATNGGSPTAIVKIYAGEGATGTLLGQGALIPIASNRTNTWDLNSLNIKVVSGQKYTAMFSGNVGVAFQYGTPANPAIDYYPGGRVINFGSANHDMFFSATITQLTPVLTPEHLATNVSRVTPLTLQFDRAMKVNTGTVTLKNLTTNALTSINVANLIINGSLVTIPNTTTLDLNTQYEIVVPATALSATTGISFAGLAATKWTFTTSNKAVPVITSTLGNLTNAASIPFTINFSEAVTGFDISDLSVTNGTAASFSGSGQSYTVNITPTTSGIVSLQVPIDVTTEGNELATKTVFFDNVLPTVVTKTDTVRLNNVGNGSTTTAKINNGTSDNSTKTANLVLSLSKTSFTCTDLGNQTVTLSATDSVGNVGTATAIVTVLPFAPVVIAKNITVQLSAAGTVTVPAADVNNSSYAGCNNAALTFSLSKSTFTCSDIGANTVTLSANDGYGNTRTATAVVTVQNKILPTVITKNITAQLSVNTSTATITPQLVDNGSTGNCPGALTLSLSKTTFGCNELGDNVVVLTATDAQGNVKSANATITVIAGIADVNLTATLPTVTTGTGTTITTDSSQLGVNYTLRNNTGNVVVGTAIPGTGSPLSFNTGNLTSTQTFNVLGESNAPAVTSALDFDGVNDLVVTNITTPTTTTLTLEAWIFPRSTNYDRLISSYSNVSGAGEILFDTYGGLPDNGRGLRFFLKDATQTSSVLAPNVLTLNAWNHVAATLGSGVMKIYVNGVVVASSAVLVTTLPASTNTIRLGEDAVIGTAEYFNGKLDDVRIWTTERTASQILANMNSCLIGNEVGLKSYFKISEGSGTVLTDLKASATGTLTNMDPATDWVAGKLNCTLACPFQMTDLVTVTVDTPTELDSYENSKSKISFSPNPVSSELNIQSDSEIQKVNIYSVLGNLILTDTQNKIQVSALNKGVYIIVITTTDGKYKSRFVKE